MHFADKKIEEIFCPESAHEYGEIYFEERPKTHIYSLYDPYDKLLYIGQARNVQERFKQHCKTFSQVFLCKYFKVDCDDAFNIEFELICRFTPPLNKSLPSTKKHFTLFEYQSKDVGFHSHRVRVFVLLDELKISEVRGFYLVSDLDKVSQRLNEVGVE